MVNGWGEYNNPMNQNYHDPYVSQQIEDEIKKGGYSAKELIAEAKRDNLHLVG